MTRAAAERQRGVAHALRWCARALLVVAGTAIAWAIASATANAAADTVHSTPAAETNDGDTTSATVAAVGSVNDVTWGVSDFVGATGGTVAHVVRPVGKVAEPAPLRHRAHRVLAPDFADADVAGEVGGAVHHLAEDAVLRPVQRTLGTVEHLVREPAETPRVIDQALTPAKDFGKTVWSVLHAGGHDLLPLPELTGDRAERPAVPGGPQPPADAVTPPAPNAAPEASADPFGAVWSAARGVLVRDAAPHVEHPAKRDLPLPFAPVRVPLAPLTAPNAPGGSSAGGHFDGSLIGLPTGVPSAADSAAAGSVRSGVRHVMVEPGAQPGVTPD
ncbi:hypothetical protein [Amycolatopsis anabasis]|uniref:hypothetical protein n=1 Tax=Amycolatopsis anabasis TaxID=1840409 RepID=UPI00131E1079|nr:hypothetical protein [Amycolatopsis anabasis]